MLELRAGDRAVDWLAFVVCDEDQGARCGSATANGAELCSLQGS